MGDDVTAPNEGDADLPDAATLADLCDWIVDNHYGASVIGGSTWAVRIGGPNGPAVAVVSIPDRARSRITYVAAPDEPLGELAEAHLDYLLRQDVADTVRLIEQDPLRPNLRLGRATSG